MKYTLLLLSILIISSCSNLEDLAPEDYDCVNQADIPQHPRADELQAFVEEKVREGLPGLSLMVRTQDGNSWVGAAGKADIHNNVPLLPCHRMIVASVSKVATATAIFKLRDQGKLDINDKLSDYLSGEYMDKIENAKKVTIKQLLNHTSGLYDYLNPIKWELTSVNEPYKSGTPQEKLEFAYGKSPDHEPGKTYAYSNTNFVLLGLLVEELSGQTLAEFSMMEIFEPLNLSSVFIGNSQDHLPNGTPKGYLDVHGNGKLIMSEFWYHYDLATGDGGMVTTMLDLGIFIEQLLAGNVISEESLSIMKDEFELPEDWKGFYHEGNGHGFEVFETPYGKAYGHTGAVYGFLTIAWHFPDSGVTIMHSINGVSDEIFEIREDLTDELMEMIFEPS
ncbi:MAG: serine hydrolase domain-containing protein [Cyclobacteriaceae bacterium]